MIPVELRRLQVPPSSPIRDAYLDFANNTSLLGVQHFLRKKSIVWLLAYLACVALSILQSWNVTVTFFEQRTFHMETITNNVLMPFPSVTVCTNVVLKEGFNFSLIPGFNNSIHQLLLSQCSNPNLAKEWSTLIENNTMAVLRYLRTLREEERMKLSLNLSEFVTTCDLGQQPCNFSDPNSVHIFNHAYFGNCFTFNPAFDDRWAKQTKFHETLELNFRLPPKGYKLRPYRKAVVTFRIHAPGTAPLLQPPESQIVFGGQKAIIALELTESTVFQKWLQSMPSCVDVDDWDYRKRSRYFHPKSPYRYSLEACMKSCEQDYIGDNCKMVNPFLATQSEAYERDKTAHFIQNCVFKHALTIKSCNCPRPCLKTDYHMIRQDTDLDNIPCEHVMHQNNTDHLSDHGHHHHHGHQDKAIIDIFFRTHVYVKLDEHLSYSLSDYLGILGGNMSLWIGLSVISLLEVVELVIIVTIAYLQNPCPKQHKRIAINTIRKRTTYMVKRAKSWTD